MRPGLVVLGVHRAGHDYRSGILGSQGPRSPSELLSGMDKRREVVPSGRPQSVK